MKYYRNKVDGAVWGFNSDGSEDYLITDDFVAMTDEEVELHKNPPPTPEQILASQSAILVSLKAEAESQKTALTARINTLQDAIDNVGVEGMEDFAATPEEQAEFPKRKSQLTKWKNYAILLGRVTTQAGWPPDAVWPAKPTEGMDLSTNSAKTPDTL